MTKQERAAYMKAYRKANKAKIAAKEKAYQQANKAKIAARVRAYQKAYQKAYRQANPEKEAARMRAYQQANPERCADISARRRARKRGATVEKVSRKLVYERDGGKCHLCGKKVGKHWHLDHIVPLARGGEHSYKNVAVAHAKCNGSKGVKGGAQLRLL